MNPLAPLRVGCRRAALPFALVVVALLAPSSAAQAQRLLTLVSGVAEAASVGGLGPSIGPVPTAVQVDLELLRAAPARLEVPTPDGSVLSAEQSVFEDRGGGDLMWSGGQPGAGYDTVVLTVEGGRLVGRFGAAGGGVYQIHAERDGRGGMAPLVGPGPDGPVPWCAVEAGADSAHDAHAHVRAGALAADLPERVSSQERYDRLDILVAYTATAAKNWADRGGAHAAIRHAGDYLKMVFRNNDLPVEPHIVHIARASSVLDRAGRVLSADPAEDHPPPDHPLPEHPLWRALSFEGELWRLRREHRADMVHVFSGKHRLLFRYVCGSARSLRKGHTAESFASGAVGWTINDPNICGDYAAVFVHEIGHGLGAHHDVANLLPFGTFGLEEELESLFRPDSLGHWNFDVMPSIGTAMSYQGHIEPFFSTPRIRPWGATVGIAGEADNERTLRETVHMGVRFSDYLRLPDGVPEAPSGLQVRFAGGAAHLSWRGNAPDADGYVVYYWYSTRAGKDGRGPHPVPKGQTRAVLPLEVTEPGTYYLFAVMATKEGVSSPQSNRVEKVVPGKPIAAPSDVSVTVGPRLEVHVRWADNADNESGFDIQLLQDGEPIRRERVAADSENVTLLATIGALPQVGAEYGVRLFAYNSLGYSEGSEVATFQWEHPLAAGRVADVAAMAIGPTTVRVTWTVDPIARSYLVQAKLPGWSQGFSHSHGDGSGTAWVDFEGLARGGRYRFDVTTAGGRATAYLALGERGAGPRAPSDLSPPTLSEELRLSWKDNSSDELGFEIQRGLVLPDGRVRERWSRVAIVPPGTEEAIVDNPPGLGDAARFRVFAYNEKGFSFSSPRVPERPSVPSGSCRADGETLCLRDSRFQVKVNWWKADGESGVGQVVEEGTDDSGMFQFFGPENWEILVKVLDGCGINGRVWVLGASTTDLGYRIRVADTVTGTLRSYVNEPGQPAPAIVDTKAFSLPCRGGAGP